MSLCLFDFFYDAQDKYLHTNCLAALANMAAHFRRLHSYVCERLLSLLCVLNKRRLRLIQQLKSAAAASATSAEGPRLVPSSR